MIAQFIIDLFVFNFRFKLWMAQMMMETCLKDLERYSQILSFLNTNISFIRHILLAILVLAVNSIAHYLKLMGNVYLIFLRSCAFDKCHCGYACCTNVIAQILI